MRRLVTLALPALLLAGFTLLARAQDNPGNPGKEKLQELQDFIGTWEASGGPDGKKGSLKGNWKETLQWNWRFKGEDAWLNLEVKGGKVLEGGDLRWDADKKAYVLVAKLPSGKTQTFEGSFKKEILTLEHLDKGTQERTQISMNTAAEGVRLIYRVKKATGGGKLFAPLWLVQANREGESLAAKDSKQVCVVSGGAGTMPVSHKGETFYVCCSGCRDAFNENPEKYIKEFKAKKK